jgi:hypothetical protein
VISKQDLILRISKDIRDMMEVKASQKLQWIRDRMIEICIGVENVCLWDNIQDEFLERVNECSKKFPTASYGAFVKIVNHSAKAKPTLQKIVSENII